MGPVVVSPGGATALGLPAGATSAELEVPGLEPFATPVCVRACIYDGNLGVTFTARRVLALDLRRERLLIGEPA